MHIIASSITRGFLLPFSFLFLGVVTSNAQEKRYDKEDFLYFNFGYSLLVQTSPSLSQPGFPITSSVGLLFDFPFSQSNDYTWGFATGGGIRQSFFNNDLRISSSEDKESIIAKLSPNEFSSNFLSLFSLEGETQFRFRTHSSDVDIYRVYLGFRYAYHLDKSSTFINDEFEVEYHNLSALSDFEYGFTLTLGYHIYNINVFYSLSSIFQKGTLFADTELKANVLQVGWTIFIF